MSSRKNFVVTIFILIALVALQFANPVGVQAAGTVGTGTPASCTEAAFDAALTGGGAVDFNCGGAPHTIVLTGVKTIASNTQINGGGLITLSGGGTVRLFTVNSSITLTLSNLTVTSGLAANNLGGAILANSNSTVNISNSTFSNNSANDTVAPYLTGHGGAIYVSNGATVNISNSTFQGNTTLNGYGGAIYVDAGNLNIVNSTFDNNSANVDAVGDLALGGGAIQNNDGTVDISGSTFSNNSVLSYTADGGAIYNGDFDGGPGVPDGNPDVLSITNSTFYNNRVRSLADAEADSAGAIRSASTLTLIHNTFSNNDSGIFSGAGDESGAVTVTHGTATLTNNIFANSTTADCAVRATITSIASAGNLIENNFAAPNGCGTPASTGDPVLGALQDNGGPTQTMALGGGSPALNALATCPVGADQRGVDRPQPSGGNCDIGAYELDNTPPTVTINQAVGQADPTNASPINFTVVFSEAVTGFATGDVTLSGTAGATTAVVTGGPITFNVAVSGMTGDGTVIASIPANVATDTAGNNNAASTSTDNTVTYDITGPTVTINQAIGQADPTNASPINFTVVFSEAVTGFATGDVTLSGTAGATTAVVTGGPTTFNVAVSGMTGDGTVIASIPANVATDAAGNNNAASTSTDNTVTYDTTGPTVTINQAVGQADPTNASPINFTVVFSEAVTGFATGDVTLSGTAGATTAVVTGGPITFNVAVSGMTGDGTVIASIPANVATDTAGNNNAASTSTDNTVTYDTTGPTVTINQAVGQADPTNTSPINFTVVFSEAVTGFATGDVTLSGTAGATTATVTGGPVSFNVAVSGMTGDGTVIASIPANVATDVAGNNNATSTSTDNTVTYDTTGPTVTINQAIGQADPTNASPINFTVVFSEAVTGFDDTDVTLGGTAGATTAVVTGGPTTYNVAVSGMTGDGTVTASVIAGAVTDALGNPSAASTSTDNTVTYDVSAPTVTINQAVGQSDPTNASPINFTVVFSEAVTGFATGDVTLGGTAGATTATVTGGPTTYNVAVSGMTGDGTVIASIPAGVAVDVVGNSNAASTSTDNTVTYDVSAPTVTINQAVGQADPTNASPINFTVVFSEAVTGFATGDVTLSGTAGATTAVVTGGPITFNVAVSGMTGDGTVIASIPANAATDAAGNNNAASTSTDNTVTYDASGPTVTINQAVGQADPTNASPINFTVVFSESVTGFDAADVTLGGTAGATTAIVTGGPTTFNVAVSGMTSDGTVTASIPAGAAVDASNNPNAASTSTDNTVTYDTTGPTVTINQAVGQADPTNASPINFTVVFSEAVTGFATGDVTLSGTAGATTAVVTGGPATYNVAVSGMTGNGTVIASIPANVATDTAGNNNAVSTSTDNTVTYDASGPTVTINQAVGQTDPTNASPINFTVVFSESVTGFDGADVTLGGTAGATTAVVTGGPATYNVAVSGMTGDGTVIASIPAGAAVDGSSNPNSASTSTDNTVTFDATAPTVTINQAIGQADPTNASPINFTVVFSEAVTGFTAGDVTLGGTAGATTAVVTGGPTNFNVAVSGMTGDGTVIASIPANAATDAAGNNNAASTSTDNTVTYNSSLPDTTITSNPTNPSNVTSAAFTFSSPDADVVGFECRLDSGSFAPCTSPQNYAGLSAGFHTFEVRAVDNVGNVDPFPASYTWLIDLGFPTVSTTTPANGSSVPAPGPTQLTVQFSENVKNDGAAGAANNTANYLLVEPGADTVFNTLSCSGGLIADDAQIAVDSASYTNNGGTGPFVATLNINGGTPLPLGTYRLFVCGTTSIEDLAGNELNNGTADAIITFTVVAAPATQPGTTTTLSIPATGFAQDRVTPLPFQSPEMAYASTNMWIEIPKLGVKMSIVGVPQTSSGWDVTWLNRDAGWLNGSAFPTWNGNSVITAHVWDALNNPGPFAKLKDLKHGDQIKIHAFGQVFVYEVRESLRISPTNTAAMLKPQEKSWLTLITCEDYQEISQKYSYRRMVRAVLVSVTPAK